LIRIRFLAILGARLQQALADLVINGGSQIYAGSGYLVALSLRRIALLRPLTSRTPPEYTTSLTELLIVLRGEAIYQIVPRLPLVLRSLQELADAFGPAADITPPGERSGAVLELPGRRTTPKHHFLQGQFIDFEQKSAGGPAAGEEKWGHRDRDLGRRRSR